MIPDTTSISITAELECFGHFVTEIEGRAYCLDNAPDLDVVTWMTGTDEEIEMAGPYGTPIEDAVHDALWKEARSALNLARLHEAFVEAAAQSRYGAETEAAMGRVG